MIKAKSECIAVAILNICSSVAGRSDAARGVHSGFLFEK